MLISILVFLTSFSFYSYNLAPSITVGDAGELIASCKILGINHAPGYPLFSLFGKLFLAIIPFGNIAYRINIMSALFGSATVLLIYFTLKNQAQNDTVEKVQQCHPKLVSGSLLSSVNGMLKQPVKQVQGMLREGSQNKIFPLIASLVFAVSFSFVRASIQTEVFTLNSFFAALLIFISLTKISNQKLKVKYLYLISFIFGIGLGNHHTLVLLLPGIVYYTVKRDKVKRLEGKKGFSFSLSHFFAFSLFFTLGFSIYFYLPIRAVKEPGFNVGNPTTLSKVIRVIRRADYGTLKLTVGEKEKYDLKTIFRQTKRALTGMSHQFSLVGFMLAVIGIYYVLKKNRQLAIFLFLIYFFAVPFFIYLGNLPFNAESEGILDRFYVMGNIPLIFMIFYGAEAVGGILKNKAATVAFLTAPLFLTLWNNLSSYNWRNYFLAHDYGKNLLKTIAPGSAFFMDGGDDTFYSMGYFVFAKKSRTDIELYDRGGVVFKSPYGDDFRKLSRDEKEIRRKKVEAEKSKIKPVYFSTFNKDIMSPQKVSQVGILYASRQVENNLFPLYSLRNLFDNFSDYRSRALQPLYPFLERQFSSEPLKYLNYCAARWPDVLWLRSNVKIELTLTAYQKFSEGKYDEAKNIYETILKTHPDDASSLVNLGVIYEKNGDEESALKYYQKALEANPSYTMAYYNSAVIYWKRSDWKNVVFYLEKVLEYDPNNEQARRYLEMARALQNYRR